MLLPVDETIASLSNGTAIVSFCLLAAFAFLAMLSTTVWVGGIIWETWILPPDLPSLEPELQRGAGNAARRFRYVAACMLGLLFVADIGLALTELALSGSGWMTTTSSSDWVSRILVDSRLDSLWYMRQVIVVLALIVTLNSLQHTSPTGGMGRLLGRDRNSQILCLLGLVLLLTFALPGVSSTFSWAAIYSAATDYVFTIVVVLWLGGLLYVGYVLLPALGGMSSRQRARVLVHSLPTFGRVAITGGVCVLAVGYVNSTFQLVPWAEFLTTTYGRALAVMFELLIVLLAMVAYQSFVLRPRLVEALNAQDTAMTRDDRDYMSYLREPLHDASRATAGAAPADTGDKPGDGGSDAADETPAEGELVTRTRDLEERLRDWLRREALLGGALLLALVLVGIFAVSLLPNFTAATRGAGRSLGPYVSTETVQHYAVTMKISPDTFGTNTFTVTLKDDSGRPVSGARVMVAASSLDMDMGTQTVRLGQVGKGAPGSYTGQSELSMAGHWQAQVTIRVPDSRIPLTLDFQFSATY